jgi:hypothetical protein
LNASDESEVRAKQHNANRAGSSLSADQRCQLVQVADDQREGCAGDAQNPRREFLDFGGIPSATKSGCPDGTLFERVSEDFLRVSLLGHWPSISRGRVHAYSTRAARGGERIMTAIERDPIRPTLGAGNSRL